MKLVEINWNPTTRQLRQFGFISFLALPALGWIWGRGNSTVVVVLAAIGVAMAVLAGAAPRVLKPVFLALTMITIPIGMIVGEIVMLVIYFGLFFPMGVVFRLVQRDRLQLRRDAAAKSYWQRKKQPSSAASYYRQS